MMNDTAIRVNYPTVVSIRYQEDDSVIATDDNEEVVEIDEALVNAWVDPNAYQELRAREYPPVADYLDGIAKADDLQVQKYIDECQAVKAKYPKKAKAKKK
tara:strand:+ start:327 stop:629 length:303 start_codon:yes stop_codon:yes gene_type:complete